MPHPLDKTDHRPWAVPDGPWVMMQKWRDLLFAHWSVPADWLQPLIPAGLTLDTFEGQAWIGVVPFWMYDIHPRYLPAVPWLSAFAELNVRTYVTAPDGKPGVWFMSLDAANPVAVMLARRFFHLPYFNAKMRVRREGDTIHYESIRTHKNAPEGIFRGQYTPISDLFYTKPGTLEYFLVERYCLYAADRHGQLYRGEIHHFPWGLYEARAQIEENTVAPFVLPDTEPLLHYTHGVDVVVWAIEKVGT